VDKKILLAVLTITILGAGVLTSTKVFAETATSNNPMSTLVAKIAEKFGLNKNEVQLVFDQDRADRQAEMKTKYEERLTQDIKDGKLTESQKVLILAKRQEIEASRQQNRPKDRGSLTEEERKTVREANKTKMEEERQALEDWAKQNNIDVKYLFGGLGIRGGQGGRPPGAGE